MTRPDRSAGGTVVSGASADQWSDSDPWTVLRLILWSAEYLTKKGVPSGRLDAEHLLAHVLGVNRLQLYIEFERPLTPEELDAFRPLLKRRATREPLQYVIGYQPFRELELKVVPGVLIPRPETEELVGVILEWIAALWPGGWPEKGVLARGLAGLSLLAAVLYICRSPVTSAGHTLHRASLILAALFLLSPVQFPWYFLWVAPMLALFPIRGLLLAVPLLPLYYGYFHLQPRGMADLQTYGLVWLIWIPVWAIMLHDVLRKPS